ncbi:replication initiation protein RepC [Jannaschia aquimarina]|nr:replication initiation protein RepC [Jannaschia aquimarina]
MQRSQVGDLIREVRRALGLSAPAITLLQKLIDMTRPRDWTDPHSEPVCYAAQVRIAHELGCSPRQIRTHEARLIRAGLIEDRRRANGSRSKHGLCGLGLTPLIRRIPELLAARDRLRDAWTDQERRVSRRSVLYRRAKALLMELQPARPDDAEVNALTASFLAWPSSSRLRRLRPNDLATHLSAAAHLVDRLEALRAMTFESSGRADGEFRRSIKATTEATPVLCSARPSAGGRDGGDEPRERANNGADCRESERRSRSPDWTRRLTPFGLRAIASDPFRLYLDHESRGRTQPRIEDFLLAALRRLPELGISPSAWEDACDRMGEVTAMLCVLVIDANRHHPVTPIRRPGGALRAMTKRHAAGELNLVGSLAGLMARAGTS